MVLVFGADHIYRMDVRQMVDFHLEREAQATVAALPVPLKDASAFGIIDADERCCIRGFLEKPANPPAMATDPTRAYASMGNYLFDAEVLVQALQEAHERGENDFGKHVLPRMIEGGRLYAYDFGQNRVPGVRAYEEQGYWRDVGTLDAYYAANMDLVDPLPVFNLYNEKWPVYSHQPPLPPAKVSENLTTGASHVWSSLLCQGSIVSGAGVERSIVGPGVYVDQRSRITDSILFPGVRVGAGSRLRRCILDKNVVVPPGTKIGFDEEADAARFTVSAGGVVVVEKGRDLGAEP
jgi:glucose-1-phosphate adenylyltransferase